MVAMLFQNLCKHSVDPFDFLKTELCKKSLYDLAGLISKTLSQGCNAFSARR